MKSDTLRYGENLVLDGPLVADILECLSSDLAVLCPVCLDLGVVCGRCHVRSSVVRRLMQLPEASSGL